MVILPGAEEFGRLVHAVYLTLQRGFRDIQIFVRSKEAIALIGDVRKLKPEQLADLKVGYLKALEEIEQVAAHGKALKMTDPQVEAFMYLREKSPKLTADQVMKEMDAWKVTKERGFPFGFQSAEQFERFRSVAGKELRKALKKADPQAEAFLQGSSLSGISYKRKLPFDELSDFDVAIASRALMKKAEKLGYEVKLSPRRVGPLDPDQVEALGLGRLLDRLGEVVEDEAKVAASAGGAAPRKIEFMLFDTEEAVKKPIGMASSETERAAIPLKGKEKE